MNKNAAEILIKAREKKGLKQHEVAERLAKALGQTYSLRQYQKLEEGKFPKFKKEIAKELDAILSTSLYEAIYEQKDESISPAVVMRVLDRLSEGFAAQSRTIENIEKNMAQRDSQTTLQDDLTLVLETLRTVAARQEADEETILHSLGRIEGLPEKKLFQDAGKRKSQIEKTAAAFGNGPV